MSAPSAEATPGELLMVSSPESVIGVRAGADTLPLGHSLKKAHVDSAAGSPGVALGNPSKVRIECTCVNTCNRLPVGGVLLVTAT